MTLAVGDTIPKHPLRYMGEDGPQEAGYDELFSGKKTVVFGLPGAFTGTCTSAHLPSFMRTEAQFRAKGVDEIICVSVNDVFVMKAWAEDTGASDTGIKMLCDTDSAFTQALGLIFEAPPVGLLGRSQRYAMIVEDGKITTLDVEGGPGECTVSAGETLLEKL